MSRAAFGVRADHRGVAATGEGLPEDRQEAAEGVGGDAQTSREREDDPAEAAVRGSREDDQGKEVS